MTSKEPEYEDGELISTNTCPRPHRADESPFEAYDVSVEVEGKRHTLRIPRKYILLSTDEKADLIKGQKLYEAGVRVASDQKRQIESLQALLNGARAQVEELQNDLMMLATTIASKERAIQHHQALRREMRHEITTMRALMRAPLKVLWSIIRGRAISLERHLRQQALAEQVRMGESLRKEFSL